MKKTLCLLSLLLVLTSAESDFRTEITHSSIRTIESHTDNDSISLDDFKSDSLINNSDGFELNAIKQYNKELFESIDYISVDDNEEYEINFSVQYIRSQSTLILKAFAENDEESMLIDQLPGLITFNNRGYQDVMFLIDSEQVWVSDLLKQYGDLDHIGFVEWIASVAGFFTDAIQDLVEEAVEDIKDALNEIGAFVIQIVGDVLQLVIYTVNLTGYGYFLTIVGSRALQIEEEVNTTYYNDGTSSTEHTGIYHSTFNCWQQYFGNDDLYDYVFENATDMVAAQMFLDIDNDDSDDYVFWGWKGNYMNLGAGCELGIYKKTQTQYFGPAWTVDTDLAMTMNLRLSEINHGELIDWDGNGQKQWWITGFYSGLQYPDFSVQGLIAEFDVVVDFSNDASDNESFFNSCNSSNSRTIINFSNTHFDSSSLSFALSI